MGTYDKAYIYFDTNTLECRHSGKSLYLSQFTVNPLFYEIEDMIRNMKLNDKVDICIPDVVWYELQEHLVNHFKSEKKSMEAKIDAFRKSFGNLAEVSLEFKDCLTESEYFEYVNEIAKDFLSNPRVNASIIPCPKDEETINHIIQKAIHSTRPFRTAKSGRKEYTDAGFKDALIFNTIVTHTQNHLGIFISSDNDFSELFNDQETNNLKRCSSAKEVQRILSQAFNVTYDDIIESLLNTDDYLMQRILSECELDTSLNATNLTIKSCKIYEDSVDVIFIALIGEEKFSFDITYNMNAHELLNASCEIFDESEDE